MSLTLTEKIIKNHLVEGNMVKGEKILIKIDQTLTQDATGTMAFLQLEALGIDRVQTELSVSYVDHNTLQTGFENADDHAYLKSVADKFGVYFSRSGNGICHQVHLERFGKPGKTLLGSDSHTPSGGGIGMIAIGAGGLDVACAMAGIPFSVVMPKIVNIKLINKLRNGVSAKDVILKVLEMLTVKGGVNKVIEYTGDGIKYLTVPERATITNMGAELGATTSVFPSDEVTRDFLKRQQREEDYVELLPDEGCTYDEEYVIDLSKLEPLAAAPHMPDNVKKVKDLTDIKVNQVIIGSCTNSSYTDLMRAASILKGRKIHEDVSLAIAPGSRQVLKMITKSGILADFLDAGARILESACGPCIGMGQSPATNAVSLRTFNRNFYGRSGTPSAEVYLVSPETAAISAIKGYFSSAEDEKLDYYEVPSIYEVDDEHIIKPSFKDDIKRGPNIRPLPQGTELENSFSKKVILKAVDNITTDHIMPAGSKVLPLRSNIEKISDYVFAPVIPDFKQRALDNNGGIIVAGSNYGQGSSREHAALAPMYLGIKAVITKSFARIHRANLINFGILPLVFVDETIYDKIDEYDELEFNDLNNLKENSILIINNKTKGFSFEVSHNLSARDIEVIKDGGLLKHLSKRRNK